MRIRSLLGFFFAALTLLGAPQLARADAPLELTAFDKATGQPVACRVHLKDSQGKPVLAPPLPAWKDHFVIPGPTTITLPPGKYSYEIERGPEYFMRSGEFALAADGA